MVCGMRLRMCGAGDRLSRSAPVWCLICDTRSVFELHDWCAHKPGLTICSERTNGLGRQGKVRKGWVGKGRVAKRS